MVIIKLNNNTGLLELNEEEMQRIEGGWIGFAGLLIAGFALGYESWKKCCWTSTTVIILCTVHILIICVNGALYFGTNYTWSFLYEKKHSIVEYKKEIC